MNSFVTDTHDIEALIEHAFKSISGLSSRYDYAWIGAPMNNVQDDTDDVIPEALILRDIAFQHDAISKGLGRPSGAEYDAIRRINGDTFTDYGALLLEHDKAQVAGRTMSRLMVKGGRMCFEYGVCDSSVAREYIAKSATGVPVRMSHGFVALIDPSGEYKAIHTYERSALIKQRPANPFTFWVAAKSNYRGDALMQEIHAALKPQEKQ